MKNYWKEENEEKAQHFGITCTLPDEPIIFYKDGSWVPVNKATSRQLKRHLDFLHSQGFIGAKERASMWALPMPQGEMAYDIWESQLEHAEEMPVRPLIDAIEDELRKRSE